MQGTLSLLRRRSGIYRVLCGDCVSFYIEQSGKLKNCGLLCISFSFLHVTTPHIFVQNMLRVCLWNAAVIYQLSKRIGL